MLRGAGQQSQGVRATSPRLPMPRLTASLSSSAAAVVPQAVRSPVPDELHMFDYGTECHSYIGLPRPCNQVVYGQEVPPAYDFSRIKAPLVVFTGTPTCVCTHGDARR
jgi:hypothetical protein